MSMLNWAQAKVYILERGSRRAHVFNRAGGEWKDYLEGILRKAIDSGVHSHPSVGKTLYPPIRRHKEEKFHDDPGCS